MNIIEHSNLEYFGQLEEKADFKGSTYKMAEQWT